MSTNKRLLKERVKVARNPIPYVTFDGDDDSMSDAASNINEWRLVLVLNPAHDSLDDATTIGKAADSPYCHPPSSGKKNGGLLSGVSRAAKSSKKSSHDKAGQTPQGGPAYFAFQLDFPPTYPFKPPAITVLSETYHPNIKRNSGEICDHMLTGDGWAPTLNINKICARLRKFLCDPDPAHPLENDTAQLLVEKPEEYASAAFKHAAEYATKGKAEEAMANGRQKN